MNVTIDLAIPCETIEQMVYDQYHLDETVKLTKMEHDEMSDLCSFTFEVDVAVSKQICRDWDSDSFAAGLVEEAI